MVGKIKLTIVSLLVAMSSYGQFSINGGGTLIKGFSPGLPYAGLHLGVEVPRDDAVSFYGRFTHCFANNDLDSAGVYLTARDINTLPPGYSYQPLVGAMPSMNYNIIEGGTRYYLGDGFDFGFGAYGGSTIMLVFNRVKMNYEPYDEELYYVETASNYEGSIFSLGFGFQGGVKYTEQPFGTIYLDVGLSYMILRQPSTNYVWPYMYNPLLFSFNLGYRKDIFR